MFICYSATSCETFVVACRRCLSGRYRTRQNSVGESTEDVDCFIVGLVYCIVEVSNRNFIRSY